MTPFEAALYRCDHLVNARYKVRKFLTRESDAEQAKLLALAMIDVAAAALVHTTDEDVALYLYRKYMAIREGRPLDC